MCWQIVSQTSNIVITGFLFLKNWIITNIADQYIPQCAAAVLSLVSREVSLLRLCLTSCGSHFLPVSSTMADTKERVFLDNAAFSWTPKKPAHRPTCAWMSNSPSAFITRSFNDRRNVGVWWDASRQQHQSTETHWFLLTYLNINIHKWAWRDS